MSVFALERGIGLNPTRRFQFLQRKLCEPYRSFGVAVFSPFSRLKWFLNSLIEICGCGRFHQVGIVVEVAMPAGSVAFESLIRISRQQ